MKKLVAFSLAIQLSGLPGTIAFANQNISQNDLQAKVVRQLEVIEKDGWSFVNQNQSRVSMSELLSSAVNTGTFYAISPLIDDIKGRLTVRVQLEAPSSDELAFRMSALSRDGLRTVASRRFSISLDASKAEETKLKFARTLNSMSAEINSDIDYAQNRSGMSKAIAALGSLFVPAAHAGMDNTAKMLKTVAEGACMIGVLLMLCANYSTKGGKVRLNPVAWLTVAAFVVGGVSYISSGIVADLK